MKLSGWGRYPVLDCRLEKLRRCEDLPGILEPGGTLIARGNGRSYGDAALNPDLTLSMLQMDRMQAFDTETGVLTCEAGVLLADVLETFVPRGWLPPVVPGTRFVTIGGMVAADVHGKNHHRDGSFGAHVESITLAAEGEIRVCSRTENAEVFRATLGGMGLTGVILSASFRLRPIETAFVMQEVLPTRDLDETMASFEDSPDWPWSVAWIDCLARGGKLGRGLVSRGTSIARNDLPASFASSPLRPATPSRWTIPGDAPASLLNRFSLGLLNGLYHRWGRAHAGTRPVHFEPFFFPLDRIGAWNRLYGRRGFVQHQCVLPVDESRAGIAALLECVAASRQCAFLASLKLLGPEGEGLMSFPLEGYTLALDIPMRPGTLEVLNALDEIAHAHGGRVYLAKDAGCTPERLREGYPRCSAFESIRAGLARGEHKFASGLSRRLDL